MHTLNVMRMPPCGKGQESSRFFGDAPGLEAGFGAPAWDCRL